MKSPLLTAAALSLLCSFVGAYEITGAKPIDKLSAEQAKAKQGKKLITVVYKGADNNCPHCAAAAENGIKAVRASSEMVVITEAQTKDKALMSTLPPAVQKVLSTQPTNAWVSFTVFDPDLTKVIASGNRETLETDKKAIREFSNKVHEAVKEVK